MHSTKQELNYNRSDILDVEAASILLGYTVIVPTYKQAPHTLFQGAWPSESIFLKKGT
jgi:hypothetical protein